ncbi:oocyte zinc finger protein XlCOF22-like isoform X2 [Eleutherodactylus coqui]
MTSMDNDSIYMTDRILRLTLEIMFLLTGEDYTIVKKTYVDHITSVHSPTRSGGRGAAKEADTIPTTGFVNQERNKEILQLANQIVELLTGEVPVRCQDVAVYFSIEEWDYIGKQNLYKNIIMDDHQLSAQGEPPVLTPKYVIEEDLIEEPLNDLNTTTIKSPSSGERPFFTSAHQIKVKIEDDIIEDLLDTTTIKSPTTSEPVSFDLSKPGMSADCMERHDFVGTARKPLSYPECGEQPVLIVKHELEDDFIEDPLNDSNSTTIKSPTSSDHFSSDLSKWEPMMADNVDHDDCSGPAQEPLSCSECGKSFRFRSRLIAHARIHTGEKPFSCPECGKCFVRKSQLVQHTKIHTGEEQCSFCGKCFTQKSKLIQHERTHTGERPFSCHRCGLCFAQEATLTKHERIHTGEKPFSCSECGKRFMLKSYLRCHQRIHTGEKPFSCSYCNKDFTQKSHLSEHTKIHTGAKLFSCLECDKNFTQKSGLLLHQRLHTGEKPFSCSECGKSFIKKAQLVQHKRIHTGEEQCLVCGKCFTHKSKLMDHQRSHTGERPFTCHQCGKSFALKTTLTRHQRLHTGAKLLCCSECGKCFMQKSDLCRHQRTHTGQEPL